MLFSKLFRRKRRERVVETESSSRREYKYESKAIDTRLFGPNMPKHQPCPEGHGWKRRESKTRGGARYWCNRCQGFFFVRAPAP